MEEAAKELTADDFTVEVDGTEVTPSEVKADETGAKYTLTIESLLGKAGKVSVNGTEADYDFAAPKVKSLSIANNQDLKVALSGYVGDTEISKADFEVKVNGADAEFKFEAIANNEVSLELTYALSDGDEVEVVGLGDLEDSSAKATYEEATYEKVEAVASIVYDAVDGQFLTMKVDGVEKTAAEVAKEGYEVTFQADAAVLAGGTTNATGEINGAAAALVSGTPFEYKVTIKKGNTVLSSDYVKVDVYAEGDTASAINTISFTTTNIDTLSSNKIVVGEAGINVKEVKADIIDGRKNVDLMALVGANIEFTSSDPTIAYVNPTTGAITAKKAGAVTITAKSGSAEKSVSLQVVTQARELNSSTYTGGTVKLIENGAAFVTKSFVVKDQYGDTWNTTNILTDATVVEAVSGGKTLTDGATAIAAGTATKGEVDVTITTNGNGDVGTGNVLIKSESRTIATIPVSVIAATTSVTKSLDLSASTIDLNPNEDSDEIEFTLKEYLSGHFNQDLDLTDDLSGNATPNYKVEIFDANGTKIYEDDAAAATVTLTRADLIAETAGLTTIDQADGAVTDAVAAALGNYETGTGLIKILDSSSNLVTTANFSIKNTAPTISSATFNSGVDFTATNATSLKLSDVINTVTPSAYGHDGVIRYQAVVGATNTLLVYFDDATTPDGYSYASGDILIGTLVATPVNSVNTLAFNVGAVTNAKASDVTIDSSALTKGDKVQLDFNKFGDTSVGRIVMERK